MLLLLSCKKNNEKNISSEVSPLQKQIYKIVDSMSVSFPKDYPVNLYTVYHQSKNKRNYIKVSTSEFFNKDSVSTIEINNNKTIVYYSKDFFKQKRANLVAYREFEYTDTTVSLYHPRYAVFEILNNNTFKNISLEKSIKMQLFNYNDRYIPEPAPQAK